MHDLRRAGRNLVVVERRENVLRIAAVDAVAVAVEHEDVDEMRPRIYFVEHAQRTVAAHDAPGTRGPRVHPDFVRVHRPLREGMAQPQGADDHFEQIIFPALQLRHLRTQRRRERAVHRAAFLESEEIDAHRALEKFLVRLHDFRLAAQMCDPGVRRREKMVVDAERTVGRIENCAPKSADGFSGMWQPLQLTCAFSG